MGNGADRTSPVTIEFTEIEATSSLTLDFDLPGSKIVLLSSNQFIPKRMTANGDIKISTPTLVVENRLDSNQGDIYITSGTPSLSVRGHDHSSITASERLSLTNVENITFSGKVSLSSLSLTDASPEVHANRVTLLKNTELGLDRGGLIETQQLTMGNGSRIVVGGGSTTESNLDIRLTLKSRSDLAVAGQKAEIQEFTAVHRLTIALEAPNGSVVAAFGGIPEALLTGVSQRNFSVIVNTGDVSLGTISSGGELAIRNNDVNGKLSVSSSATLSSYGDLELISSGRITIGQGAILSAKGLAPHRIVLSVGELKQQIQKGPSPTFMSVTTGGSGQVFFGKNGVRIDCCGAMATAIDNQIIFNTGKFSGDRIHIEGGTSFSATTTALSNGSTDERIVPVSFVESATPINSHYCHKSDGVQIFGNEPFSVTRMANGVLKISNDRVIIDTTKRIELLCGAHIVQVAANSILVANVQTDVVQLIVLSGHCSLSSDQRIKMSINSGEEIVLSTIYSKVESVFQRFNLSRRQIRITKTDKSYVGSSEVSLLSVHRSSQLLRAVAHLHSTIAQKFLKTCAALQLVTGARGPYDQ